MVVELRAASKHGAKPGVSVWRERSCDDDALPDGAVQQWVQIPPWDPRPAVITFQGWRYRYRPAASAVPVYELEEA